MNTTLTPGTISVRPESSVPFGDAEEVTVRMDDTTFTLDAVDAAHLASQILRVLPTGLQADAIARLLK